MHRMLKCLALTAIVVLAGTWTVTHGQGYTPGSLDPSFGTDGATSMSLSPNLIRKVAVQRVGGEDMVLAVGNGTWRLARHRANGSLDADFGVRGVVTKTFKGGAGNLDGGVVVQLDGKLLVAGAVPVTIGKNTVNAFAVGRFNANGTTDTSFGTNGVVAVAASPDGPTLASSATGVVVQANGYIVLVGNAGTADGKKCLSVVRLLPGGGLDTTFGTGGRFSYRHTAGFFTNASAVTTQTVTDAQGQPEERIVVAGFGENANYPALNYDFGLVLRLTANGALDGTFGAGTGIATIRIPSALVSYFRGVAIDSLNRIVAAGQVMYRVGSAYLYDRVVARFLEDGEADGDFNGGALFIERLANSVSVYGVAVDPDDRILVAGIYNSSSESGGAVWRLASDGSVDTGFGTAGMAGYPSAQFYDIALVDGTNTYVTAGRILSKNSTSYWTLWRYFY